MTAFLSASVSFCCGVETDHRVVSREEWLKARTELLAKEKEFTRAGEAMNQAQRDLPWVEVTDRYEFEGAKGRETLSDGADAPLREPAELVEVAEGVEKRRRPRVAAACGVTGLYQPDGRASGVSFARVLAEYARSYFNTARPHQGIGQRTPVASDPVRAAFAGSLTALPVLGGLHHDYCAAA